jgi:adenylate cyclase
MNSMRKFLRSPFSGAVFISGLVFLIITGFRFAGTLEFLELTAYDWLIRLQPGVSGSDPRITIVGVTENDIRSQGRWPLTDFTLAQALSILTQHKPRAIGLDIFRDITVPPGSEKLDSILTANKNIIVVTKFGERGVPPPVVLSDTDQVAFNDILVDPGGIVRRALLFLDDGKNILYSFALRLALIYLQEEGVIPQPDPANPQHIRLGHTTIRPLEPNDGGYVGSDARGYQFLLDFKGAKGNFPSYSLKNLLSGEIDSRTIRDKIVLIGVTAQSVKDLFYTPNSRGLRASQQVSGVVLHAHMVSQLLRFALDGTSAMATTTERQEVCWILLWSIIGGAMGLWVRSPWRFAMMGSGELLILLLAAYFAFLSRLWVPLVPPAMSWLISAAVVTAYMSNREKRRRALLMQLFSRHVSKEVADTIWQQRDQFLDGGRPRSQKLTVTVFFSDLRGFTSVSEKMDPQDLIEWLNTYMESMVQLVMQHSGVIDDYAGDGIKANFGVPLPRTSEDEIRRDATNAVNCALAMEKEIGRLNAVWQQKQLPAVGIRIGIYTGPAVAGPLGSSQRLKYTTVGDTVNIAARLESYDKELAKETPCRILIGESTLRCLGSKFKTQLVGEASLKGKEEKITIYHILGQENDNSNIKFQEVIT